MAVISAYFDDSGDDRDKQARVLSVAGYVGTVENWQYFEREWEKALKDHGVPYLHMKKLAHFKHPFEKYKDNEGDRIALLQSLIKVIEDANLKCIGSIVNLNDLKRFNKQHKDNINAYAFNLYHCMNQICDKYPKTDVEMLVDRTNKVGKKIEIAKGYAKGDRHIKDCLDYIDARPLTPHRTFMQVIPIQAADFLAYEIRKDVETTDFNFSSSEIVNWPKLPDHTPRKSLENLVTSTCQEILLSAINSLTYWETYAINIACKKSMLAPYRHLRKNIFAN